MNKQAARRIILAQVASDGGKRIEELLNALPEAIKPEAETAWSHGYAYKDTLLKQACEIVARHHDSDIRFFVVEDKQKVAKFIVYFDIKVNGKRWQASFHSYSKNWSKWTKSSAASMGSWDHKSSRETCLVLAKALFS